LTAYSFLVETAQAFQPPYANALDEFERVWPLLLAFLEKPVSLVGHITHNGAAVKASITVREFGQDLNAASDPVFGLYGIFLPAGTWTLVVSSPSIPSPVSYTVTIQNGSSQTLDIAL